MASSSLNRKPRDRVPTTPARQESLARPVVQPQWNGPPRAVSRPQLEEPREQSIAVYCRRAAAAIVAWLALALISGHLLAGMVILAGTVAFIAAAAAWGIWVLDNTL